LKYRTYSTEQFAQDESFIAWVLKSDKNAVAFWEEFYHANPAKQSEMYEAIRIIEEIEFQDDLTPAEQAEEWNKLYYKIQAENQQKKTSYFKWAAVIVPLVLAGVSVFYFNLKDETIATGYGEKKEFYLPDSTQIILNANSDLSYKITDDYREVWLTGEAFFEVKKVTRNDKRVNFTVHTENADVEVLGTSFNVNNRRERLKVVLNSGEIKLMCKDSVLWMQPGQMAEVSATDAILKQVNVNYYTAWRSNVIPFESVPLPEIIDLLEDNYGLQIEVKTRQDISDMRFKGTFLLNQGADVFLEILAESFDFNLKKENENVILYH